MRANFSKYWAAMKAGDHLLAKETLQSKKSFHAQALLDTGMGPERDGDDNIPPPKLKHGIKTMDKAAWVAYRRKNYPDVDKVTGYDGKQGEKENKDGVAKEKNGKNKEKKKAGDGEKA